MNERNVRGLTSLAKLAERVSYMGTDSADMLLKAGFDVNILSQNGNTPVILRTIHENPVFLNAGKCW